MYGEQQREREIRRSTIFVTNKLSCYTVLSNRESRKFVLFYGNINGEKEQGAKGYLAKMHQLHGIRTWVCQ